MPDIRRAGRGRGPRGLPLAPAAAFLYEACPLLLAAASAAPRGRALGLVVAPLAVVGLGALTSARP
ncbi:hypothetical protein Slala03_14900 [Streptomyces lavendulae subsp. lavendulae]|uniref:hypothetical protein n=1 Tax=Streptomyces lavendulae TaxID=1914 RepID=UPI0024A2E497|nr:hypothetical protein [Streptomyces lavendulae]GLV81801.1 hypothetical protein Slala03_14900 [Streptomyces lavendulae subsp. lavendulae]